MDGQPSRPIVTLGFFSPSRIPSKASRMISFAFGSLPGFLLSFMGRMVLIFSPCIEIGKALAVNQLFIICRLIR